MKMYKTIVDNEFGILRVQMYLGVPYIHCELKKWSHTLYKAYRVVFDRFMAQMAEAGHPVVFVVIEEGDEKLLKFEKMFGFEEETRDDGKILLKRYTDGH